MLESRSDPSSVGVATPGARQPPISPAPTTVAKVAAKPRHRIGSTALVLVLAGSISLVFSAVGYCVGRNTESELRFFEPRRSPTSDEACIACPIEYALHSNEENDVIFVGDSTCRVDVDPMHFERVSGLRAYNLGSQGKVGPMGFLITAKAYLARHPRPRIVVLSVAPIAFEGTTEDIAEKTHSTMQARFEANYGPEVPGLIPWSESASYFVKRGTLTAWMKLSSSLVGGGQSGRMEDVRDLPLAGVDYSYRMYQGFVRQKRGYAPVRELHIPRWSNELLGSPVKIEDEWDGNVRMLADDCEKLGIRLFIRFSPMPRDMLHARDFSPLERWAKSLQESHRSVIVGSPLLLWYDPELCWDHIHLNLPGVAVYTPVLAKEVREALGGQAERR
jgi:hypothetical protein